MIRPCRSCRGRPTRSTWRSGPRASSCRLATGSVSPSWGVTTTTDAKGCLRVRRGDAGIRCERPRRPGGESSGRLRPAGDSLLRREPPAVPAASGDPTRLSGDALIAEPIGRDPCSPVERALLTRHRRHQPTVARSRAAVEWRSCGPAARVCSPAVVGGSHRVWLASHRRPSVR